MGRNIDLTKPLSAEDRAWLREWSRHETIKQNDALFGHLDEDGQQEAVEQADADHQYDAEREAAMNAVPDTGGFDADLLEHVATLKVAEMRAALMKMGEDSTGPASAIENRLLNKLQDDREAATQS